MDKIYIDELYVKTIIGVESWERKTKQTLLVSVELAINASMASQHDDICDAINYADVCQHIETYIATTQYQLIETLAEKTTAMILDTFPVPWVQLTVKKPHAVPGTQCISVTIQRGVVPLPH